jgi:hypothetical protein
MRVPGDRPGSGILAGSFDAVGERGRTIEGVESGRYSAQVLLRRIAAHFS